MIKEISLEEATEICAEVTRCIFELPSNDTRLQIFKEEFAKYVYTKIAAAESYDVMIIDFKVGHNGQLTEAVSESLLKSKIILPDQPLPGKIAMYNQIGTFLII
jgi:predicted membrane-bound spermidine synthase